MAIYIGYNMGSNNSLSHHGVKGMHWGVRNYQNLNGSLTDLGYIHYYGHARRERQRGYSIEEIVKDKRFQKAVSEWNKKEGVSEITRKAHTYIAAVKAVKEMGLKGQDRRDVIKMILEEARVKSISTSGLSNEEREDFERLTKDHLDVDKVEEFSKYIKKNMYNANWAVGKTEGIKNAIAELMKRPDMVPFVYRSYVYYSPDQQTRFVKTVCEEVLKELGYKPTFAATRYIAPLVFHRCYYNGYRFFFVGPGAARLGTYL